MSGDTKNPSPENTQPHHKIEYVGAAGELWPIVLMNLLLTIVTLGIYRFWAKTNIRQYLWSHTRFDGEPFDYTGTGGELFMGALIVFLVFIPVSIGLSYGMTLYPEMGLYVVIGLYPFFIFLMGVAIYRAQVYRMSRTNWRRIRGAQVPKSAAYGWLTLKYVVLYLITFGLITPYVICRMWNFMMNNKRFGSGVVSCDVKAKPLYKVFLLTVLAVIVVIGGLFFILYGAMKSQNMVLFFSVYIMMFLAMSVIFSWFQAALISHLFSGLKFEDMAFKIYIEPLEYLRFSVVNMLILIFTLGLGAPFITQRWLRLICEKLTFIGKVDFDQISQSPEEGPVFGEGLVEAFDIG